MIDTGVTNNMSKMLAPSICARYLCVSVRACFGVKFCGVSILETSSQISSNNMFSYEIGLFFSYSFSWQHSNLSFWTIVAIQFVYVHVLALRTYLKTQKYKIIIYCRIGSSFNDGSFIEWSNILNKRLLSNFLNYLNWRLMKAYSGSAFLLVSNV